ncbi:FtsX-like permease family protein [Streptococcus panodentis]|uniref:ABC transporter permease n=1 Tax=Streptococcus panodentis TaxID=1581472 RepID=A0ABS5AYV2_9STRE|nr:FtsX-like permease family protein [Streptococcus panodentis]MBP2620869.1 ABC transporter permease [Streptococcus panodentis]
MFKLTSKLAFSNLVKNRSLYYPFALATLVATAILYSFVSLAYSSNMEASYGGAAARSTLQFGIWVIQIAVLILITYANSFVMKNRSRELGVYSLLGMEKKHLLVMTFFELFYFALLTVGLGLGLGLILDKMLYALLLKFMGMQVVIASTFQWSNVLLVLISLGLAFGVILLLNSTRLLRYSSLHLVKEKKAGEKKGRFLLLQTILGLGLMGAAYYIALTVTHPVSALVIFFWAVLMVIFATYLLFNAGSITLLNFLKKRKGYYYKAENFISVSNLISRMRKNAAGLATISILSTMLLVTLVGTLNIYIGGQDYLNGLYPKDYNISLGLSKPEEVSSFSEKVKSLAQEAGLKDPSYTDHLYQLTYLTQLSGNQLTATDKVDASLISSAAGILMLVNREDYEKMTGQSLELADDEAAIYAKNVSFQQDQPLRVNDKDWKIKQVLSENFTYGQLPVDYAMVSDKNIYMVVNDINQVGLQTGYSYYMGIQSETKENQTFQTASQNQLAELSEAQGGGNFNVTVRASIEREYKGLVGTLLFIGVFLSIIFLLGAVLLIYYKQISEGYEDREGFVILQKVGLDEKQTKSTIRKQILTVFFLPLIFAFCHIAAAFHMLRLIVALLGVTNVPLLIQITIGTCGIFLLAYILVFLLTSRSYRRIVAR